MAETKIKMPNMGESIIECTVLNWLVKEGDEVQEDDMILEVATDKIDTEIGSPFSGIIGKLLVDIGDVVQIGASIATIYGENIEESTSEESAFEPIPTEIPGLELVTEDTTEVEKPFFSPLVLSIAKKENISLEELKNINGTGLNGRLTKQDLLEHLKKTPVVTRATNDTIIEMDRMRLMIADRMVESKKTAPHVTSFVEADVTTIVNWRKKNVDYYYEKYNNKLTFTPIFIQAIVKAIIKFPLINSQLVGNQIIQKANINIGIAVALPSGNLIVPVIKNADQYNLQQLSAKVNDLAFRARENKLKPDELTEGTFTVSNIGTFNNIAGTPIIMQPQVAILALGAIKKQPAVIETPEGDFIGIRQKMILSHSYDHRIIDGALGGGFLNQVGINLENFDSKTSI